MFAGYDENGIDGLLKEQILNHLISTKDKGGSHSTELVKIAISFGSIIRVLRLELHQIKTVRDGRYAYYVYIAGPPEGKKSKKPKAIDAIKTAIQSQGSVTADEWFELMEQLNIEVKWKTNCRPYV